MDDGDGTKVVPRPDDASCLGSCNHGHVSVELSESGLMQMITVVKRKQDGVNVSSGIEDFIRHASI